MEFVIKILTGNPYYIVNWCENVAEFGSDRPFPLVYMHNGELCYSLLAYLKHLFAIGAAKQTSSLNDLFRCIAEISIFYEKSTVQHFRWSKDPRLLIIDYFEKCLHGTIRDGNCDLDLWWQGRSVSNIKRMLTAFSKYESFCTDYLQTDPLSTSEVICESALSYSAYKRKQEFNMLAHLTDFVAEPPTKNGHHLAHGNEVDQNKRKRVPKFFPPSFVMPFIDSALDANQQALYLLCAFCGLRASEAVQIFINDIVAVQGTLVPDVIIDHPVSGETWCHKTSKLIKRTKVLETFCDPDFFDPTLSEKELSYARHPIPRCNAIKPMHAGWKGVLLEPQIPIFGYILQWTNDAAKIKFFNLVNKKLLSQKRANHPFLFCAGNGAPLSLSTYEKRIERESKRLTGQKYGSHSLRHFCGFYLSNTLDFRLEDARSILRHKRIESTNVYYHVTSEKLAEAFGKAKNKENQIPNKWKELSFNKWIKQ